MTSDCGGIRLIPVSNKVGIDDIINVTAAYYGRTVDQLTGPGLRYPLTEQRQVAMYLCRELTGSSLPTIGEAFGRHHTTVLYGVRQVGRLSKTRLQRDILRLRVLLAREVA